MVLKHNLSILYSQENPVWGVMLELNHASNGIFGWCLLLIVFAVTTWVSTKQTQDLGKSLLIGLWITTLSSMILFYAGKETIGVTVTRPLVSEIVMLTLLVGTAVSVAAMYFLRNKGA